MKRSHVFILVGIFVLLVALFGPRLGLFGILPAGGYNMYGDCIFTTNVDPIDSNAQVYEDSQAWIAIDVNNDGVMEKFGWYDERISSTSPAQWCGYAQDADSGSYELLVEDFNSHTCSGGDQDDIYYNYVTDEIQFLYVCSCTGMIAERFRLNYGVAPNAIIPSECEGSQNCNTNADTNCDNIVSRDELGNYITKWQNNEVSRDELGNAITAWIA